MNLLSKCNHYCHHSLPICGFQRVVRPLSWLVLTNAFSNVLSDLLVLTNAFSSVSLNFGFVGLFYFSLLFIIVLLSISSLLTGHISLFLYMYKHILIFVFSRGTKSSGQLYICELAFSGPSSLFFVSFPWAGFVRRLVHNHLFFPPFARGAYPPLWHGNCMFAC